MTRTEPGQWFIGDGIILAGRLTLFAISDPPSHQSIWEFVALGEAANDNLRVRIRKFAGPHPNVELRTSSSGP